LKHLLTERYRERLAGVLSCYDRIIVTGTLPGACYAQGMTAFLSARQVPIFDYPRFAEPLRDRVRERAAELAGAAGMTIEHIAKSHIRKEDIVAAGQRQMSALLLLLHRRRTRLDLSARADLVSVSLAVLLQWP
jgi:hypothetical protein